MDKKLVAEFGFIPTAIMTIDAFFGILERFGIDIPGSKQFDQTLFGENRTAIYIIGCMGSRSFYRVLHTLEERERQEKREETRKKEKVVFT